MREIGTGSLIVVAQVLFSTSVSHSLQIMFTYQNLSYKLTNSKFMFSYRRISALDNLLRNRRFGRARLLTVPDFLN